MTRHDLRAVPLTKSQVNAYIAEYHRHHGPVVGYRFAIGCERAGELVGAVVVGRPVAPKTEQYQVAEVTRLVSDGTPNMCSFLYGRAARAAEAMGFSRIQTFTLQSEGGGQLARRRLAVRGYVRPARQRDDRLGLARWARGEAAIRAKMALGPRFRVIWKNMLAVDRSTQ